ncbi:unnamed protein product [Ambrosiozyma monospora]|uniref:Unnamed protein product n=1 Tax=Ambrosiozyma monospora TaxID=43982 RepID=A0ACB5TYG6_AMBMO|nr:unnamed protein product [Ambrosiozyma monospora]
MIVDGNELTMLKERLNSAGSTYEKLERICTDEKQQVAELVSHRTEIMGDTFSEVQQKTPQDYLRFEELLNNSLTSLQKFTGDDTRRVIAEVEIETIQTATEGKDMTIIRVEEKKKKSRFGSLFKKGAHDQPGDQESDDVQSLASGMSKIHTTSGGLKKGRLFGAVSRNISMVSHGTTSTSRSAADSASPTATAMYAYSATGDDELTIHAGDVIKVTELDDGSGWTTVELNGEVGMVPTSYIRVIEPVVVASAPASSGKKQGPKVAPRRGAKKVKYMEILYDYNAQGEDEVTVLAGDKVLVVTEDDGSGWTEGEIEGEKGLFPTSYGRMV